VENYANNKGHLRRPAFRDFRPAANVAFAYSSFEGNAEDLLEKMRSASLGKPRPVIARQRDRQVLIQMLGRVNKWMAGVEMLTRRERHLEQNGTT
jgi:hypothetical protein